MIKYATQRIIEESRPYTEEVSKDEILKQLDDIANFMAFAVDFMKSNDVQSAERAAMQATIKLQSVMTTLRGGTE